MSNKVKTCCCLDQGSVSIVSYFEKDQYMPGEIANMVSEFDNSKCKVPLKHLNGDFVQVMQFRA
jgi:hypothetical protein